MKVLRWKGDETYRSSLVRIVKSRELIDHNGLQGLIDLPVNPGDVELKARLKAVGKLRSKVGRLEIRFIDRSNKLLIPLVPGFWKRLTTWWRFHLLAAINLMVI